MAKVTLANGDSGSTIRSALNAMFTELYYLLVGKAGGNTIVGGTLTTQGLTLKANAADDTTGTVAVSSSLTSTAKTNGALTVAGGVGISGTLFAGDATVDAATIGALSGVLKATAGVVSAATAATDYAPATSGTAILKGDNAGGFAAAAAGTDYAAATSGTDILKGDGSGGFAAAAAGTDYAAATTGTAILKGNGAGGFSDAQADTDYLAPNVAITGATKTKVTYDAQGLVTAGADATTADIASSTNARYVSDVASTNVELMDNVGGVPFRATNTLTSAAAATPVHLIPAATIPTGMKIYVTDFLLTVNGATAWTDATGSAVSLQDTAVAPVVGAVISKTALMGNAVLGKIANGVSLDNPILLGLGFTAEKGLDIVADDNFTNGDDIVITVTGFIAP